jgi:protein-S-isoprenylcysteine O-methyltransferase Ste14
MGHLCTILTALWFPSLRHSFTAAHVLGMLFFLAGAVYRLWAVRALGEFYSHKVQTVSNHTIVDSGPYRFTRHPAYMGMIIAHVGICLYFFNWVVLAVFCLVMVPAIIFRIIVEEKVLFEVDGYDAFAKSRKRLIPAVW